MDTHAAINPALTRWDGPHGLPRFEAIRDDDFAPAFERFLAEHAAEVEAIAGDPAPPTFANTIAALERAGEGLSRVSALFWNKAGADTNDAIRALEREIGPKLSRHFSQIGMNAALFARIDRLVREQDGLHLSEEEKRVLKRHWKGFVHAGALLPKADQERLAAINERLAALRAAFGQNVLADEEAFVLLLDEGDLDGLPEDLRGAMAAEAERRGAAGRFAVTLNRSLIEPFLTSSARRDLREAAFKAWIARGETGGATDNRAIMAETLALRAEAAALLGYDSAAAFKLDDTMAKTPEAVNGLLMEVWTRARARARAEEAEIAGLIAEEGGNHEVMPWDWRYYAEKVRERRYAFSESDVKPYLDLDRMMAAAFDVAERLFGLRAVPRPDIAGYHPDVRVFEMREADGRLRALFLSDPFARPTKHSGAWMSSFQTQNRLARDGRTEQIPIVYNVMNVARPAAGKPALLSLDEARTLFHEFGHALHGMLSDVTYPSVSGTAVPRDFVELPSQLYEHWFTVPEVLSRHARHHETGAPIPEALRDRMLSARTFNAGFATVEFTASALVDMAFHTRRAVDDPMAVEREVLQAIDMPRAIVMRHRSPHFAHIFAGGYAAGYYAYMWSEVLDADAFAAFAEAGDPFHPDTARRLRDNIYATGGSRDPEEAYVAFRGRLPAVDAMLAKKGLAVAEALERLPT